MVRLSVIVPVYNGEDTIRDCLESLQRLKSSQIEFIIIDDGSTDQTLKICRSFEEKDDRFRIFHRPNGGVSAARDQGIAVSRGENIAFVDSDDSVTLHFDGLIDLLEEGAYDLYIFDPAFVYADRSVIVRHHELKRGQNDISRFYKSVLNNDENSVWSHVYKRSIIVENKIRFDPSMRFGEDLVFNLDYCRACRSFYYIDKVLYLYTRERQDSAMHKIKEGYLDDCCKIYDRYKDIYDLTGGVKWEFDDLYYMSLIYNIFREHGRSIQKEREMRFRNSALFLYLMDKDDRRCFSGSKMRLYIKFRLYKVSILNRRKKNEDRDIDIIS